MQALLQRYLHVSDQGAIDRRIAIVARRKHAAGEEWWVEEYRIWIELEGQGGRRRAQAHGRRFVHGGHTSQAPGGRLAGERPKVTRRERPKVTRRERPEVPRRERPEVPRGERCEWRPVGEVG